MRRKLLLLGAVAVVAAFALPTVVSAAGVLMEAKLKGSEEPSGGDPNGKGEAVVVANKKKEKVNFTLTYKNIADPVAAHIHKGKQGVDGPIVVPLEEGSFPSGDSGTVKNVDKDLIRKMIKKPQNYYVNIHTGDFPGGAIRGQLSIEASG